jgi:hypothetical protein
VLAQPEGHDRGKQKAQPYPSGSYATNEPKTGPRKPFQARLWPFSLPGCARKGEQQRDVGQAAVIW